MGVVGAGRVGAVLASRFRAAGHPVVVSGRSEATRLRARTMLPGVAVLAPSEVAAQVDVLVLAVPDDVLAEVAAELAPHVTAGSVVLHTSGRHGLEPLRPLTDRGARPVAFHPAMTFTGTDIDLSRPCVIGLTAADAEREVAERLVATLGGSPMWIAEADRATYHAALAHGANHLVTVVNQAMELLRSIGAADPSAVLGPLLEAALSNTLAYGDAALTGPVVRGDVDTVRAHRDALASHPGIESTYRVLAEATADRAEADDRLSSDRADKIRRAVTTEPAR
ncbi:ketopantoate reductase PanE/ApbA [Aeromicrobium marinum DSM 15272]|uniref:Ketopantoate reductase PanE/ApbA n=1 Tax=Aeromicrobium marinum DSM 15272 TaxID=585531 RepID=E2SC47_9ACTN|nr:ketopantoate reductase PanE/ApbA [Aeromicrobium marinum DSM 15272]